MAEKTLILVNVVISINIIRLSNTFLTIPFRYLNFIYSPQLLPSQDVESQVGVDSSEHEPGTHSVVEHSVFSAMTA